MCGICGLVALDGGAVDAAPLRSMSAALAHRGPDSQGELVDGPVALAARRLAIVDLEHGDQPLASEDGGVQVVQNGEIYNHAELAGRLRRAGHRLATRSDTEVLAHLYEERGDAFLEELRGMFAIALWDARARRLLLARDPFGIKPLYWTARGGTLAFASELGALARWPGTPSEIDPEAVEAYLAFNAIPAPLSILRGVHKLPAGHLLEWSPGGEARLRRWARPSPAPATAVREERFGALAREVRERLADSVRAHLVADVPVGVFLSGGVDSSALAALATREAGRISTFSIGFEERSFDELARARRVARRLGSDHHEEVLRPDAVELLPEIVAAFDEPFADSSALPTYAVSRLAAGHVKVALSGEGGDELFGGYYTYAAHRLAQRLGGAAALARPLVERLPSSSRKASLDLRLKRFVRAAALPPVERHHRFKEIFSPEARAALLGGRATARDPVDVLRARYAETEGADPLTRLQDLDVGVYLVDDLLVKTDRASMAHSLEVRVPFCDPAVAELAFALPARAKVLGLAKKRVLRAAVAPLVPREVVYGRKQGFSIPAAAWLRGPLAPYAREVLSDPAVRRAGIFAPAAVGTVLDDHISGREGRSRELWGLLCFALWQEGRARAPAGTAS